MWPPGPLPMLRCQPNDVISMVGDTGSEPNSYCCRFSPRPGAFHVLASANEDGYIQLWDSRPSAAQTPLIQSAEAHSNAIYELDWAADGRHLLSAAGDRVIKLWDTERMTPLAEFRRHSRTVKTVTFLPDDSCVFASGSRDGSIDVYDIRVTNQISHHIQPPVLNYAGRSRAAAAALPVSVTALLFRDATYLLSAISSDSTVSVWDLRRTYPAWGRQPQPVHLLSGGVASRGVTCLSADRSTGRLYVSRVNGAVQRYCLSAWTADGAEFCGHQCSTFFVRCCVSPCGSLLASGSSDAAGYLWRTGSFGAPAARLPGYEEEVTCVAWSQDSRTLATLSDDLQLRFWRTGIASADHRPAPPDGTLWMETLRQPPGPPLSRYSFQRETGVTAWRPHAGGTAPPRQVVDGGPLTPQCNSSGARTPRSGRTPGSSRFLSSWLRGGRVGRRTSPRKRAQQETAAVTPSRAEDRPGTPPRGKENRPVTPEQTAARRPRTPSPRKVAGAASLATRTSPRKAAAAPPPGPSPSAAAGPRTPLTAAAAAAAERASPRTPARCSPRKHSAKALFADADPADTPCGCGGACVCRTTSDQHTSAVGERLSSPCTPLRCQRRGSAPASDQYRSPTANLPNWVVDGVSPHRPAASRPRRAPTADWLTRLSQKKRAQGSPAPPPAEKRPRRTAAARGRPS